MALPQGIGPYAEQTWIIPTKRRQTLFTFIVFIPGLAPTISFLGHTPTIFEEPYPDHVMHFSLFLYFH